MTLGQGNLLCNRYRILEILGRGGMGAVYRATDESLGVDVAVKENLFTTDDYAQQFHMEAIILANLRHQNLPRVTDHFVIEDMGQYLVMDYIEGDDLRQCMEKSGPISEEEAIRIGVAACDALAYLHSRRPPILHRDIKLGNIKLSPDGGIYLVDFGLAKMAWEHEETMTGARAMTPGYSPPEQYGSARTDARSDIYSLGATLYAAITGVIPEDSLMRAVDGMALTPLRDHRPEITLRLASVIEKAMEVTPCNRYQTAEEFKRALLDLPAPEAKLEPESEPKSKPKPEPEQLESSLAQTQPPIPVENTITPKKGSWLGRVGIAIILLLAILAGAVWFNPPYRDMVLTQIYPSMIAPLFPAPPTTVSNTQVPVVAAPSETSSPEPTASLVPTDEPTATVEPVSTATEPSVPATEAVVVPQNTPQGGGAGEIAFASVKDNVSQIFIANADGTNVRQLTNYLNGACNFDWSPDGKQIVFVSPCLDRAMQYPNSSLYTLSVDTGDIKELFSGPVGDFEPAWSPDGKKIAYTSVRDGSMQIYIYDFDKAAPTRLTSPENNVQSRYPSWSFDGTKLTYTVRRFGLLQIWVMDADGSNKQQLVRPGGSTSDYLPVWSPDGTYVLFSETNSDLTAPSVLAKFALGEEKAKILPVQFPVVDVDFSNDGQWIAYETLDGKNQSVFIYSLGDGTSPHKLTDAAITSSFDPAWRP
jgi:Tol biopolymer transport system component